MFNVDYIIVQAGGKGTRMERLTRNKPKALVPVENLPMILHLFRKYPDKKFIVIGDYKQEVLRRYLEAFAQVDFEFVNAQGKKGTIAGMNEAISFVPEEAAFMIIWCDLILPEEYELPEIERNYVGISKDFPCRWKYEKGVFSEERSETTGVAGHFIFKNKAVLQGLPEEGEFVRWLSESDIEFEEQPLYKTKEYGLFSEWSKLQTKKCRPFNSIEIKGDRLIKRAIDDQGRALAKRECAWYKALKDASFNNIPRIYEYEPLCMDYVEGMNIYKYSDIPYEDKKDILKQIVNCLNEVHKLGSVASDEKSYRVAYLDKTFDRLKKVSELVPFAKDEFITINGKKCLNVFYCKDRLENEVMEYFPEEFKLIHGDCTFSNMMLKNDKTPVLIDPRGYFGITELYGDVAYDWVKLYYSVVGNYDQFNLKRFDLFINETDVELSIESNNWEDMEDTFFELLDGEVTKKQMQLLHAIIWLSLTTYAWEDYDSICGAFYNGLLILNEAFEG